MAKKRDEDRVLKTRFRSVLSDLLDVSGDKGYRKFLFFLIMIDLAWFLSVVADNLLGFSMGEYGEFAWTFLFGLGLVVVSNVKRLKKIGKQGFKAENFASLITFVIGCLALITSVLSLPFINIVSPILSSVKGILALIAIIYVALEAWVIKER